MTDAINNPVVRRRQQKELHSEDMEVGQRPDIDLAADELMHDTVIEPVSAEVLNKEYMAALAFDREPVEIMISRGNEKHAPLTIPCWVNGKGAEVFTNGKWAEFGWLPTGIPVTTRRMYAEVVARSKVTTIRTADAEADIREREMNLVHRDTYAKNGISILNDRNPKSREWFSRCLAEG